MKKQAVVNQELNDYILAYYINGNASISDIAKSFDMSVGGVKNFMYRHRLNKKKAYSTRNKDIKKMYKSGISVDSISKYFNCSSQNIYTILNK